MGLDFSLKSKCQVGFINQGGQNFVKIVEISKENKCIMSEYIGRFELMKEVRLLSVCPFIKWVGSKVITKLTNQGLSMTMAFRKVLNVLIPSMF